MAHRRDGSVILHRYFVRIVFLAAQSPGGLQFFVEYAEEECCDVRHDFISGMWCLLLLTSLSDYVTDLELVSATVISSVFFLRLRRPLVLAIACVTTCCCTTCWVRPSHSSVSGWHCASAGCGVGRGAYPERDACWSWATARFQSFIWRGVRLACPS